MTISEDQLEPQLQTNNRLQANIWDALKKDATVRSLDLDSLSIEVQTGDVYLNGYIEQDNLPLIESIIYSVVGVLDIHNHLKTNEGILADVWDALYREDTIRSLDLGSLSIQVKSGEVYLDGHLAKEDNLRQIERITHSIKGVVAVHSHLVLDRDLIIQVTQALSGDERTRPFILPVDALHGWIHVGGEVPNCEVQQLVKKITVEVPEVRGVTILPRITGENPTIMRTPIQPRIGAVVYGKDGEVGVVTKVVIQPDNWLVTHIVVHSKELKEGNLVARETIIPLEASDLVKNESILLHRNGSSLNAFPAFDPDEFPLAPFTWRPPYPYTAGEVCWSVREIQNEGNQPASRPEIKPGTENENATDQEMVPAGV